MILIIVAILMPELPQEKLRNHNCEFNPPQHQSGTLSNVFLGLRSVEVVNAKPEWEGTRADIKLNPKPEDN